MQTMSDIHQLASEAYACFETAQRPDGEDFTRVKDGSPEWVKGLVRTSHGRDFLPDDWRYETIRSALAFISDYDGEPDDAAFEFADSAVDAYNASRFAWLASNIQRQFYVDDAISEFGWPDDGIAAAVGLGQYQEAQEVFGLVLEALQEQAD